MLLDEWINNGKPANCVINGDCMEGTKLILNNSVNLILTDPPYGINFLSPRSNHKRIENDDYEEWKKNINLWLREWYRIIKDKGVICCFIGTGGKMPTSQIFTLEAIKEGFNLIQTVIWDKKTIGLGWRYRPSYEVIIVLSKSKDDYYFYSNSKDVSNIIKINNIIPQAADHPTPKPEKIMRFFINLHSKPGDLVLDPFGGGGTTAVACKQLGRKFICFEIDVRYCDIADKRLGQETLLEKNLLKYG